MRCKDGFRGDFEDRGKVNGGRIKERASRGDKRGSRLKFLPKADKIISVAKSAAARGRRLLALRRGIKKVKNERGD